MTTLRKHAGVNATGTGPKLRTITNLVNNPRALGSTGISGSNTSGGGGLTRQVFNTGGPLENCPSYSRCIAVEAQTTGIISQYNGASGANLTTPGKTYIAKGWIRMSIDGNVQIRTGNYLDKTFIKSFVGPVIAARANTWIPVELEMIAAAGSDRTQINLDQAANGPFLPANGWLDGTGWMLFEKPNGVTEMDTTKYADGDTAGWSWNGTPHGSASKGFGGIA